MQNRMQAVRIIHRPRFSVALLLLGLFPFIDVKIYAQQASVSSDVTARVLTPISITEAGQLEFGKVAACGSSSTVVLAPDGSRSVGAGCALLLSGATVAAAQFTVTGTPNATFSITLPASAMTLVNGPQSMTVDTFTSTPTGTGTLNAAGTQVINVGATLHVMNDQPDMSYTGSFSVTVGYN